MFANSDELFRYIQDERVEMVDVRFCDLPGVMQHFNVPVSSFDESVFTDGLGFDVTWLAAREERMLDEHLLSVGRRTATERAAYLVAFLHRRATAVGLAANRPLLIPITQQHVADTLGLSIVHTNKTLRKLAELRLIRWHDRACEVVDAEGLMEIAGWEGPSEQRRPLI